MIDAAEDPMIDAGLEARGPRLRLAWMEEWMSTLAREILPYLAERHEITYVTSGDETPAAGFARVIRCRRRRQMNLAGFEISRRVNELYRRGKIDMALTWASIGFALRGVPFINLEGTSVYAEIGLFASRTPWHARPRFLPGLLHYALPEMLSNRRAERVVVPSEALKRDVVRLHRLPARRVDVVPHGVEPRHQKLYDRKFDRGLRPSIVFVGRLHFRKGIAGLLREFVRRPDIAADFQIAGDGPDRAAMESLAAGDARVTMRGSIGRDELDRLLRGTNIFVLPTWYEGFGLSLLEAMASGHACIAYDIPVVREVLGDCGILVPVGDTAALVREVSRLTRDREAIADLASRAHRRAALFSWGDAQVAIDRIVRETAAGIAPAGARRLDTARLRRDLPGAQAPTVQP